MRGIYPDEVNERDAYRIARAFCRFMRNPKELVVGCDVRLSSPSLKKAVMKGMIDEGVRVIDVGTISTDMLYFAVANYGYPGGLSITASHNPREYNGMKFVREHSRPISSDSGLFDIRDIALREEFSNKDETYEVGEAVSHMVETKDVLEDYVKKLKTFADFSRFKKLKMVANPNFGMAGKVLSKLLEGSDMEVVKLNYDPDGSFPKGRPDPLIPENQQEISKMVIESQDDFGVAWDADADRCFFFTEKGEFIEGYFITALLAKIFIERNPGAGVVHDNRLVWAIEDIVRGSGGVSIQNKAGHAFLKEAMRREGTVFGGEMSGHYYFKDYFYCDNGMIPLVMMMEFLSACQKTLSQVMEEMFWNKYYISGEINRQVADTDEVIKRAEETYKESAASISKIDGVAIEYPDWRFSLRPSNTEPLIRLNVEAKSKELMEEKRDEVLGLIEK